MKLTANSDCWLKPVLLCSDPFRGDNNKLIFCAPIKYQIEASINRHSCDKIVNQLSESQQSVSQFIVKQPYFLVDKLTKRAIGWPFDTFDELNVSANYAVGANRAVGRDIDEAFYRASLYAGLPISASNVEDLPSMWSFELGPTPGTNIGDQLWMARYLLQYIGEQFGFVISFEPLRHIQSKHQFIQLWTTEKCCEKQLFAMNSDPYIAIKEICLAKLS
ncbi:glutamine synthetase-like [Oppia nitens]|uniref:glutamine synthetase-like n=1 Tax=Oppia nitens TaxID=1686743 RepID=UPI0023DC62D0|nr:glutamine synthetase-like [Oppia nitens]